MIASSIVRAELFSCVQVIRAEVAIWPGGNKVKIKTVAAVMGSLVMAVSMLAGCSSAQTGSTAAESENSEAVSDSTEADRASSEGASAAGDANADQAAADHVAELIDAIYVQERSDQTDEQCKAAKEAWDALTDHQKELVFGENADPDYFGRDTGDASADDPRNADDIGEQEILVVSFGTSFNNSRAKDIGGIENALQKAYPDWSVRRAFTSQIIINHVEARDGEFIDNMTQALDRAVKNGVKKLVVQPTHLMHGAEYDEMCDTVAGYEDQFDSVAIAEPLLGEVGADGTEVNHDKENVAKAVVAQAVRTAGYDTLDAAAEDGTAFVFMGHGTSHEANITYDQMQAQMDDLGYKNVFIGTVEGKPADTACEKVISKVQKAGYTKVVLRPLMVVAGDHANNDMAGDDDDSWKSRFTASGAFDSVDCQIEGMGGIPDIQAIYVAHTKDAIDTIGADDEKSAGASASGKNKSTDAAAESGDSAAAGKAAADTLADGTYSALFNTDSSMFHVNDACDGRGTLTVKNGKMSIHISLPSQNIMNLFVGTAEDAEKDGADLLEPVTDTVRYDDGTTEEVNGFDVPVERLGTEFDLALLGKKGKWYDHKVSVSDPEPLDEEDKSSAQTADGSGAAASAKGSSTAASDKDGSGKTTAGINAQAYVRLEGGSGRSFIKNPCDISEKDGKIQKAVIVWSSTTYDYMIVDGKKYTNENEGGNSTFTIPVTEYDTPVEVTADTTAMSKPHEIDYTLTFTKMQ